MAIRGDWNCLLASVWFTVVLFLVNSLSCSIVLVCCGLCWVKQIFCCKNKLCLMHNFFVKLLVCFLFLGKNPFVQTARFFWQ